MPIQNERQYSIKNEYYQSVTRLMANDHERGRRSRLAEGVEFEPTIRFPVYTLSKRAPSATGHPSGHVGRNIAAAPGVTTQAAAGPSANDGTSTAQRG